MTMLPGFIENLGESVSIEKRIRDLAAKYAGDLDEVVKARVEEMKEDDTSHYLLYGALGISHEEGELIDVYQNKGRFLYKYAGSFLEDAAKICIASRYPDARTTRIPNTLGDRPKTFEIDMLVEGVAAIEVKWRDATTDGDHISKEHTRLKCIAAAGHKPVRVMFYEPNRLQAKKIQLKLAATYLAEGGEYHAGENAWQWVRDFTGVDLYEILQKMDQEVEESAK
ncbi:TPA: ApaLI family restriction endonuclease [Stenotrophomonas maltophilia]